MMNRSLVFIGVLFLYSASVFATGNCISCHGQIETNCKLDCVSCHLAVQEKYKPTAEHPAVIPNPSTEKWWDTKCGRCHQKEIEQFKNSLHYSFAGIISQTRYLWGKDAQLELNSDRDGWKQLAKAGINLQRTSASLVDNLLAKKCMSCHFSVDNRQENSGNIRAAGCAACHSIFDQQNGKIKFGHRFQKKPPDESCLTCHNSNTVGADYYGYFEHDYHNEYNTPAFSKPHFGTFQHRLSQDVHARAGMNCLACHSSAEVMGSTEMAQYEGQQIQVRCQDCHGGFSTKGSMSAAAKQFEQQIISHKSFHKNVSCTSCHAAWSYQDYGLHLFLDETNHYDFWENYLWQGDQQVNGLLKEQLALSAQQRENAYSRNRISGQKSSGIWYKGWDFRRWEDPVLGKNKNGTYQIIRPLYQYRITYVDSLDYVWLDSEIPLRQDGQRGWSWDVYKPHTISTFARNCESCHGSVKAAGLGIRQSPSDSVAHAITLPNDPIIPGTRLLNQAEQEKLLNKSKRYRKWRAAQWRKQGIEKFLKKRGSQ